MYTNRRVLPLSKSLAIVAACGVVTMPQAFAQTVVVEPIVVTGEKRDKKLQETVAAITVLQADELDTSAVHEVKDSALSAPNVVKDSFGSISMRGISGNGAATGGLAFITGARARVATLVDGRALDWSGYNFTPTTIWDVEQIEILRGPQSSAQGASAIAGALVVTTKDPTFEQEAAVKVGLEHYDNGHMSYELAAMSSGALVEDELAYRIAFDGRQGEGWLNYEEGEYDTPNLSDSDNLNLRSKLLWQPTSIPELSAKLTLNLHKNEGEHASFASNTEAGVASQTLTLDAFTRSRVQDSDANAIAADVDYQLNSDLTHVFHLSHSRADIHADEYPSLYRYDIQQDTTSLENRLLWHPAGSDVSGLLGVFIAQKDAHFATDQGLLETDYTTTTSALYGESSYAFSKRTQATLGLRVEHESIDKTGTAFGRDQVPQDSSETYHLPKVSLTHAISDTTTVGASLRKGYSPAGSGIDVTNNTVYSYDSEEVTTFELSSKSVLASGTVLNANLFYNDYTDYQAATGFSVGNVASARTYGLELESRTWLSDNFEVNASLGLLESELRDDPLYQGNDLPSAPGNTVGLGVTHYIGNDWSYGVDASYVGKYYSDLANSESGEVGDHTLTNLRVQYQLGHLTLNGFVSNLTNEDAVYFRSGSLATVGQTRTIGVSALYRM